MQLPFLIGKYELLEFLGGGMSHVYRAHDTVIDRPVVVKILTVEANADPDAKARFLHEARIAGNIQHENIVSVFDFGEFEDRPFIVMEHLKGEDLRQAIREGRAGTLADRLRIAMDLASALEYIHQQGITHRDIKPENIHIDLNGRVKLMDFGIAKTVNLSLTRTGMAMGTPYYMSPEQVAGRASTTSVDVYAFGMLFFELLTGVRGVTGDSMEQVFFQILHAPVDVSKLEAAGVPPAVRELVLRCTAKKAEDRPQSLRPVVEVLRGAIRAASRTDELPEELPGEFLRSSQLSPPISGLGAPPTTSPSGLGLPADSTRHDLTRNDLTSYEMENEIAALPSVEETTAPLPVRSGKPWVIGFVILIAIITAVAFAYTWSRRVPAIPGMIYFPSGPFPAGASKTQTMLGAFYIGETEVSNGEFAEFCRATGCPTPPGAADLPITRITVAQARAYAQWRGERLPTAKEWERAARGIDGRRFPWGDDDDASKANLRDNPSLSQHVLMPVRSFAALPTFQMAGNAWEMVEDSMSPSAAAVASFANLMTPPPTAQEKWIQIRGGSYNTPIQAAVTYEYSPIPERYAGAVDIGFRCAKSAQ